jgi:hypothetical protein
MVLWVFPLWRVTKSLKHCLGKNNSSYSQLCYCLPLGVWARILVSIWDWYRLMPLCLRLVSLWDRILDTVFWCFWPFMIRDLASPSDPCHQTPDSYPGVDLDQDCCRSPRMLRWVMNPPFLHDLIAPLFLWCFWGNGSSTKNRPRPQFLGSQQQKVEEEYKLSLILSACILQTSHSLFLSNNMWWPLGKSLVLNFLFMEAAVKSWGPLIGSAGTKHGCKSPEHWLDSVDRFLGSMKLSFP